MDTPERSHWRVILIIAFITRLSALWLYFHGLPSNLSALSSQPLENVFIALSLHAGHGYSSPFGAPSGPTACIPPGYPYLIYLVMQLAGVGTAAFILILLLQTIFSLATVMLVMYVARRDFGTHVSNLAGLLSALGLPMLLAPLWIWETCLSALILIAFLGITPRQTWSRRLSSVLGFLAGVAGLVNPALLPSVVLICGWHLRRTRATSALFAVALLLTLSPWLVRDYLVLHAFVPVRDSFGLELWLGNQAPDLPLVDPKSSAAEMNAFLGEGEIRYMHTKQVQALGYIEAHPREFLKATGYRIVQFWAGTYERVFGTIFAFTGFVGLILLRSRSRTWILYAIPLLVFPLPYYITHAQDRYRYVLDPILAILSANALVYVLEIARGNRSESVPVPNSEVPA